MDFSDIDLWWVLGHKHEHIGKRDTYVGKTVYYEPIEPKSKCITDNPECILHGECEYADGKATCSVMKRTVDKKECKKRMFAQIGVDYRDMNFEIGKSGTYKDFYRKVLLDLC